MLRIGIVMDPIEGVNLKKDSSFAMLNEAQNRGHQLFYMQMEDLYLRDGIAFASAKELAVKYEQGNHFKFLNEQNIRLGELDCILMRKDPPFNSEFVYATYILERAEDEGCLVVNKPQSLRDCNEKLFTSWFADLTPKTLVSRSAKLIREFYAEHQDIILKPLDGMGGSSIFRIKPDDANLGVIIETLTQYQTAYCMAQKYIPEIVNGDKRILVVNGEVIPYCLARIPQNGETRGNLAAGGRGEVRPLSESDYKIANSVAPILKQKGLIFVGLDVIGDKLTEINVTSPTCVREIEGEQPQTAILDKLFSAIESMCAAKK